MLAISLLEIPFINSFNNYLLHTYYVPHSILGIEVMAGSISVALLLWNLLPGGKEKKETIK